MAAWGSGGRSGWWSIFRFRGCEMRGSGMRGSRWSIFRFRGCEGAGGVVEGGVVAGVSSDFVAARGRREW